MAQKDQQAQHGGNIHSVLAVFFLSVGYLVSILVIWVAQVPLLTCLWILVISLGVAAIAGLVTAVGESRVRRDLGY